MIDPAGLAALTLLVVAAAGAVAAMGLGDLRALYGLCSGRALAVAYQLLRDRAEAEDVVQETFLELWRRQESYDPSRGSRATWAILVARSRALDRLRARGSAARAAERAAEEPRLDHAPPAVELAEARERRERVLGALGALPPAQREAVELAYFGGLSQAEIAARTGEPLGTVKTRIRLAMEKLAEALGEDAP